LLLLRYGFALEYNIFEHVYVGVNYLESIPNTVDILDVNIKYIIIVFQITKIYAIQDQKQQNM